ncbi:hypothetical protein B9Z55_020752 [Caenorhabditis nigoni]|uniref:Uncharacterized protein n=1 Tax=Caenorhabditis nigoni TaxID=1611254 RepID=A0A2G5TNZ6_9PELO|nr:hypothetical protein B9Z55_020752 [Caenorhabditis nigoni]
MNQDKLTQKDRHSAWGSDIDETFCGPGKICGDDWTPLNSLAPTPESQRRRFSDPRIQDDMEEGIITEQPGFFENHSIIEDEVATNFDVMTIHEDFQEVPAILVAPKTAEFTIHDVILSMSGESALIKILDIRQSHDLKETI